MVNKIHMVLALKRLYQAGKNSKQVMKVKSKEGFERKDTENCFGT